MEQKNWVTGQQVAGPSGVGGSQKGGEYNYQDLIAFAVGAGAGADDGALAAGAASGGAGADDGALAAGAASSGAGAGPLHSGRGKKGGNYRHSQHQLDVMEAYFKDCPCPDQLQRNELARTLALDPAQVQYWFQNKRTQLKKQTAREENEALQFENNVLQSKKQQYMEALRNNICLACNGGGNRLSVEGNSLSLENIRLSEEIERLKSDVARFMAASDRDSQSLRKNPQNM